MKDRVQKLQALLKSAQTGGCPLGMALSLASSPILEIAGKFGFDWLLIDQEHTLIQGNTQLADLARAAELSGMPWFVKVTQADEHLNHVYFRDAMDTGAWGVMLPHVRTAKQLKDMIHWSKFPPKGVRGGCSLSRVNWFTGGRYTESTRKPIEEYMEFVNEHMFIIPTIENVLGIEHLDEILDVPGYDIIHIGIEDIWISATQGKDLPKAFEIAESVAKRIQAAGKVPMMFVRPEAADRISEEKLMLYVPDSWCMAYGFQQAVRHNRERREGFKK
ncbi:MAG: aldolase/citrate lyase family protein [Myxococcota bacterium]|nr:aldolase/citrate lyase family protein [Myxococcota bacterium]